MESLSESFSQVRSPDQCLFMSFLYVATPSHVSKYIVDGDWVIYLPNTLTLSSHKAAPSKPNSFSKARHKTYKPAADTLTKRRLFAQVYTIFCPWKCA